MNNDRTHSAVQESVANPAWGSADSDRLGYDGAGRMIAKRFLAGGIDGSTHAYNDTAPVVGFTTAFDRASNKLYERELHAESRSHLYEEFVSGDPQGGYDSLDRLRQYQRGTLASGGESISSAISLPNTDEQRDYVLDGLGNWKETDYTPVGGSLVEETRNHNKLNQITKRQPDDGDPWTNFTHDANGNLTDDGVRTYEWDALNRLYRVKRKSDGKTIAEYVYNAATHRIRKTVSNGGLSGNIPDGETNFIYNSNWQCAEERDASDALLRQYVWGRYIDELLQIREGPSDCYPLQDLLYRTTALTDDSGAIVEAYDTDAYGNTLIFDAPGTGSDWWADDASQADVPTCAFIFTGRRYDPETELYQYRHRYYAPMWGRFIARDQSGYIDGFLLYLYGRNNPVIFGDPLGSKASDPDCGCDPRPKEECCSAAFARLGAEEGRLPRGVAICCDGRSFTCTRPVILNEDPVLNPPVYIGPTEAVVQEIIRDCVRDHEQLHLDKKHVEECGCGEMTYKWSDDVDDKKAECMAKQYEYMCLSANMPRCEFTPFPALCRTLVRSRRADLRSTLDEIGC